MMHQTTFPIDSRVGKYNLIDGFRLTNSRDEGPGPSKKTSEFQENSSGFHSNSRELSIGKVRRPNLEHLLLQAPPPDYSTPIPEPKGGINDSFSYVPSVSGDWNDDEASFTIEYEEEKPRLLKPPIKQSTSNESSSENKEKFMELDPNESILASSGDPNDFGIPPSLTDYSPMFQELTRKLMEEERVKSRVLSFDETLKRLKEELEVVKEEKHREQREEQSTSSWSRPSILKKGSIRKPIRRKNGLSIHTVEYDTELMDMTEVTSEMMENMSEDELKHVCNSLFESNPRVRFRPFYPFLVEGMIQKDFVTKDLKLFSSRLRNVRIPDTREPDQMSTDYVYFVVIRQGVFGGFWYETHPSCLISAKFRSQHETILNGYAILAYPIGSKEDSMNEERWICWNDSLGLMNIKKRSAMMAMKKQPGWDKQLDIVTFQANAYNGRYVVDKIVALTNTKDKRIRIPVEIFLIVDAKFLESRRDDIVFHSKVIKSEILIKKDRIGNVDEALPYELIVVPTFPTPTIIEFRVLLIVQSTFWTEDKMWIRNKLAEKTNAYRG